MGRGDMIGAISAFSQAILQDPTSSEGYVGRGRAFRFTGGFDLAMRDLNHAIGHNPTSTAAFTERGALWFEISKTAMVDKDQLLSKALTDLSRAIELEPYNPEAYRVRSAVYTAVDGDTTQTSRGSRAVYDAYMAMQISNGFATAKAQ